MNPQQAITDLIYTLSGIKNTKYSNEAKNIYLVIADWIKDEYGITTITKDDHIKPFLLKYNSSLSEENIDKLADEINKMVNNTRYDIKHKIFVTYSISPLLISYILPLLQRSLINGISVTNLNTVSYRDSDNTTIQTIDNLINNSNEDEYKNYCQKLDLGYKDVCASNLLYCIYNNDLACFQNLINNINNKYIDNFGPGLIFKNILYLIKNNIEKIFINNIKVNKINIDNIKNKIKNKINTTTNSKIFLQSVRNVIYHDQTSKNIIDQLLASNKKVEVNDLNNDIYDKIVDNSIKLFDLTETIFTPSSTIDFKVLDNYIIIKQIINIIKNNEDKDSVELKQKEIDYLNIISSSITDLVDIKTDSIEYQDKYTIKFGVMTKSKFSLEARQELIDILTVKMKEEYLLYLKGKNTKKEELKNNTLIADAKIKDIQKTKVFKDVWIMLYSLIYQCGWFTDYNMKLVDVITWSEQNNSLIEQLGNGTYEGNRKMINYFTSVILFLNNFPILDQNNNIVLDISSAMGKTRTLLDNFKVETLPIRDVVNNLNLSMSPYKKPEPNKTFMDFLLDYGMFVQFGGDKKYNPIANKYNNRYIALNNYLHHNKIKLSKNTQDTFIKHINEINTLEDKFNKLHKNAKEGIQIGGVFSNYYVSLKKRIEKLLRLEEKIHYIIKKYDDEEEIYEIKKSQ